MTERFRRGATVVMESPAAIFEAARGSGWNLPGIFRRYLLALRRRFMPKEALTLGLLHPATRIEKFEAVTSKSEMVRAQNRLNPRSWEWVLADKGIFYAYAAAAGLPIPRVLGSYHRTAGGRAGSGRVLSTAEEWTEFLLHECPPDVVIKPNRSSCGKGVRVLRRQGDTLIDGKGRSWSPGALLESLSAHSKHAHLVQERLFNHEDLAVLTGAAGLQTVRVMTMLDRSGDPRILGAFFRAIVGTNWVDNIDMGRTGNLWVALDGETGTMTRATLIGQGFTEITHHPDTGREFAGQVIPMWSGVLDLARRAARAFWPVRTVGWDIPVTPSGPVLLEGNVWYAPPNAGPSMREVFEAMHSALPGA